jgi:surface carbohydrate biosynthesis protein (TIGR04326 family)
MAIISKQCGVLKKTFLVWDADGSPPKGQWVRVLWRGFNQEDEQDTIAIPKFVEENAHCLRKRYIEWIYELGKTRIKGKRLIDHLELENSFSYWWMTLFAEKSPYKSPINNAIRLFAFEHVIRKIRPKRIVLVGGDRIINESITRLCENYDIGYEWKKIKLPKSGWDYKKFLRQLPHPIQAMASFSRHVFIRWPLRTVKRNNWFQGDKTVLFCSYFIHLDQSLCSKGKFYSRQWEVLPKLLHNNGFFTNWIQHYLKSNVVLNSNVAIKLVQQFNSKSRVHGLHAFLDTFLSCRVLLRVVKQFLKLIITSFRLSGMSSAFVPEGSNVSLWPLMKNDWYASVRGHVAIRNLLFFELFCSALKEIPYQSTGIYLCENQAWEKAFVHAWQKNSHGRLIGVVHAAVRFWDLRYYNDSRVLIRGKNGNPMPQPDVVCLNGNAALDTYLSGGNLSSGIVKCEALRFQHLGHIKRVSRRERHASKRVLILGGIMPKSNESLLRLLEKASSLLSNSFIYNLKPHPNCMIKKENYSSLRNICVVSDHLGKIIQNYDIAYASNTTSAVVDAYLAGLSVVVMLDQDELNMCPLRGQKKVQFVSSPGELAAALEKKIQDKEKGTSKDDFLFLDPGLPRWKELLGIDPK